MRQQWSWSIRTQTSGSGRTRAVARHGVRERMRHRRGFVLEHSKHACINNGVYVHTDETVGGAPVFRYRQTDDKLHGDKALFWSAQQSMWVFTWHYSGLNETVINNASGPGIAMRCKFKNPSFGGPEAPIGNIPWQVKEQLPSCRRPIASWTEKPITVRARYKNDLTAAELALEEAVDAATRQSKNVSRTEQTLHCALVCVLTVSTDTASGRSCAAAWLSERR